MIRFLWLYIAEQGSMEYSCKRPATMQLTSAVGSTLGMSTCKEKFGDNNGVLQAQGSPGMTFTASWRGLLQRMCWSTLCSAGSSRRLSIARSWSHCRRCAFSHVAKLTSAQYIQHWLKQAPKHRAELVPLPEVRFIYLAENVINTLPAASVLAQARAQAPGRAGPAARGEAAIPLHCS